MSNLVFTVSGRPSLYAADNVNFLNSYSGREYPKGLKNGQVFAHATAWSDCNPFGFSIVGMNIHDNISPDVKARIEEKIKDFKFPAVSRGTTYIDLSLNVSDFGHVRSNRSGTMLVQTFNKISLVTIKGDAFDSYLNQGNKAHVVFENKTPQEVAEEIKTKFCNHRRDYLDKVISGEEVPVTLYNI